MTYTVRYRKQGQWFWRTIKNVKGDYPAQDCPCHILHTDKEEVIMIPFGSEIRFSSERFWSIKEKMDKEAGMPVQVNTNARPPR